MAKQKKKTEEEPDFSFKKIEEQVDQFFDKRETKEKRTRHISEKIREGIEIKENLPDEGFLEVKADEVEVETKNGKEKGVQITSTDTNGKKHVNIVKGLFQIDLRNDATWWFIRTPILSPQIYKQAIRTHLDIKKCHEPEKRRLEVPYLLIAVLVIGAAIIAISFLSMMMK